MICPASIGSRPGVYVFIHAANGPADSVTINPMPGSINVPINIAATSVRPTTVVSGKMAMATEASRAMINDP